MTGKWGRAAEVLKPRTKLHELPDQPASPTGNEIVRQFRRALPEDVESDQWLAQPSLD